MTSLLQITLKRSWNLTLRWSAIARMGHETWEKVFSWQVISTVLPFCTRSDADTSLSKITETVAATLRTMMISYKKNETKSKSDNKPEICSQKTLLSLRLPVVKRKYTALQPTLKDATRLSEITPQPSGDLWSSPNPYSSSSLAMRL